MRMNIRFAIEDDLPRLVEIYNQAVDTGISTADTEHVSVESRRCWLAEHDSDSYPIYVLCQEDETISGWLSLSAYRCGRSAVRSTAEVSYYVARDHQGQGVASQLMRHAITDGQRLGVKSLFAILLEPNQASIRLLQKFDFAEWGRFPKVAEIGGQLWDHLYMGRQIGET